MQSRIQLEGRVLALYDAVRAGGVVEDSLVELKRDWPDPKKAARRIAGHANAARGESVLWLIGLDERVGVCPARAVDLAEWWQQVGSCFEGTIPELRDCVVQTDEGPITVLQFDTALGPFVIKNPVYGSPDAGPVERELPWRDGTRIRSATREDIVRMLAPLQSLPSMEVLAATVSLTYEEGVDFGQIEPTFPIQSAPHLEWAIELELYVAPVVGAVVVLPVHRTSLLLSIAGQDLRDLVMVSENYASPSTWGGKSIRPDSVSIETTRSEAVIRLPGRLLFRSRVLQPHWQVPPDSTASMRFTVTPVYTEHAVRLEASLQPAQPKNGEAARWTLGPI